VIAVSVSRSILLAVLESVSAYTLRWETPHFESPEKLHVFICAGETVGAIFPRAKIAAFRHSPFSRAPAGARIRSFVWESVGRFSVPANALLERPGRALADVLPSDTVEVSTSASPRQNSYTIANLAPDLMRSDPTRY